MTKKFTYGLVGHHIGYSKSPDIFRSIFQRTQVDAEFRLIDLPPEEFAGRFPALLTGDFNGLAVTIPYKKQVIEFLNELDPIASVLRAVNSITIKDGWTSGYNTDCFGFSLPLKDHADKLKQGTALIFGSGGGAKAAVYSLRTEFRVSRFLVVGRSKENLTRFKSELEQSMDIGKIEIAASSETDRVLSLDYDLVVNCTPLGGPNAPKSSPLPDNFRWREGKIYYDLNYNKGNVLVDEARRQGLFSIEGSAMLVGQAIRSWHLWTGLHVDFDLIYADLFAR